MRFRAILASILLVLFTVVPAVGETIKIETSRGETSLVVPEDYDSLKDAYVNMAQLYLEERFDHEESIERVETLTKDNEELIAQVKDLSDELLTWVNKKTRPDPIQIGLLGMWEKNLIGTQNRMGIGGQVYLYERVSLGLYYKRPISAGLLVSVRIGGSKKDSSNPRRNFTRIFTRKLARMRNK